MVRIVDHLPLEALEARYRAARDATEARHYQAIWLLAQGRTVLDIAEVLAFVPRWVEELAVRDNAWPSACGRRRKTVGCGPVRQWRPGSRRGAAVRTCLRNVAGRP